MNTLHEKRIEALHQHDNPTITADMSIENALREHMRSNFTRMLESERDCRFDKNIEGLRTMRRITHQLKAVVDIAETHFNIKTGKKIKKRLRQLQERLDVVHELDVMMRDILHYGAVLAQRLTIASIVAQLDAQRLVAKERLIAFLDSKKYHKFLKRFEAYLLQPNTPEDLIPDPGTPQLLRHTLPPLLQQQLAVIQSYEPAVTTPDSELLIALRDELRLFRYTLSCFESLLGRTISDYMAELHTLEDLLTQISTLSETLHRLIHLPRLHMDNDQLTALKQYRRDLRTRRERLYEQLPETWENFNLRKTQAKFTQALLILI